MSFSAPAHVRQQRNRTRRALIIVLAIVVALAAGGVASLKLIENKFADNVARIGDPFASIPPGERPSPAPTQDDTPKTAMNLLVLGSDSRISAGDPSQWKAGAQRTDTIMLVHLPASGDGAYVMSIPRDSWVPIPGHGSAKINAAFSYGGPSLLIQTVENLTGVRIDHFVVTDFDAFKAVTDELGGVEITLKTPMTIGSKTYPAGKQLLNGVAALHYVRDRHSLPRGDFDRVHRQQAWLRAMFARVRNEGTLDNPVKSVPFFNIVSKSISADSGFTQKVMNDLASRAKTMGSTDITFFTVPFTGTGRSADGQSIVVLDTPKLKTLMDAVNADTVDAYVAANAGSLDLLKPIAN